MIKIGMCDDNISSLQILQKYINAECIEQGLEAEITVCTSNQEEIYNKISKDEIDVLFLDIDFKNFGKNGIDFARDLRLINKSFYLVFLSAHQRYMPLSFFANVFDYILKPINRDVIQELIHRLKEELKENKNQFLYLNKWAAVKINSILYIEKIGNKSFIHTKSECIESTKTLNTLLESLPSNFIKCHRSYIVNTDKIYRVDRKNHILFFTNELCCPISSQFKI